MCNSFQTALPTSWSQMVLQIETNFGLARTEKSELYLNGFVPSMIPISLQIFGRKVSSYDIVRSSLSCCCILLGSHT